MSEEKLTDHPKFTDPATGINFYLVRGNHPEHNSIRTVELHLEIPEALRAEVSTAFGVEMPENGTFYGMSGVAESVAVQGFSPLFNTLREKSFAVSKGVEQQVTNCADLHLGIGRMPSPPSKPAGPSR